MKRIEIYLLLAVIAGITLGIVFKSWFVILILPAILGVVGIIALNLIKLVEYLQKPKFTSVVKRFGKLKLKYIRNKDNVKTI